MKDYGPKPLVEEHFHIQELIAGQQKRVDDREYHRNRLKAEGEREDLIKDSKTFCVTDFYCHKCKEDFKSMSVKEIEVDWSCPSQRISFYRSKCNKGHWCIRLITDRQRDSFFIRSKLMARERGLHYADTLQPWETGFQLLYGNKNKQ